MYRYKLMLKQFFCWHFWDKVRGYETPVSGAKCLKYGKVYK